MTTPDTAAKQPKTGERFRLSEPPGRELDEKMSTVDHLHQPKRTGRFGLISTSGVKGQTNTEAMAGFTTSGCQRATANGPFPL